MAIFVHSFRWYNLQVKLSNERSWMKSWNVFYGNSNHNKYIDNSFRNISLLNEQQLYFISYNIQLLCDGEPCTSACLHGFIQCLPYLQICQNIKVDVSNFIQQNKVKAELLLYIHHPSFDSKVCGCCSSCNNVRGEIKAHNLSRVHNHFLSDRNHPDFAVDVFIYSFRKQFKRQNRRYQRQYADV